MPVTITVEDDGAYIIGGDVRLTVQRARELRLLSSGAAEHR